MYTVKDVYVFYRKQQALFFERSYRIPKDWVKFYNKIDASKRNALQKITNNFNTKWQNIDPNEYFKTGFKLFKKSFSYHKFFDRKIIKHYIQIDRNKKRESNINKRKIVDSVKYLLNEAKRKNVSLDVYCKENNYGNLVLGYTKNYIDIYTLVLLDRKGVININSNLEKRLPYFIDNKRQAYYYIKDNIKFFKEIWRILDGKKEKDR
jgi:hypothetical protein